MNRAPRTAVVTLLIVALAAAATAVWAQAVPHHVDFTQQLRGVDDQIIPGPDGKPITLDVVVVNALVNSANTQADVALTGTEKLALWDLAKKVNKNKSCALTVDELKLIMDRVGRYYAPLIVGPVMALLDPNKTGEGKLPKS